MSTAVNKVTYTLLRLFYVNDLNDQYVNAVMDTVANFPISDATAWINDLCAQIQALPTFGPAQAQKTSYVVSTLQLRLQAISDRVTQGLPAV